MLFTDILNQLNIPFVAEGKYASPGWVQFNCPFCDGGSDPNRPYCGYNLASNYVNCWRCGGHPLGKTLMSLAGISWPEAKKLLGGLEVDREALSHLPKRGKLQLPAGLGPLLPCHRKYLRGRGFDPDELVQLWGLQGIGLAPRLPWRIFIPIVYQGQTVSWTTRKTGEGGSSSRYWSARPDQEVFNHKELLYGSDYCRHSVVIVEGPTDVWRIGPGAVAVLGTGIKQKQLLGISNILVRVICFDSDVAGQHRANLLCNALSAFPGDTYNVVLDSKDPGSATPKEIKRLRKEFLE